MHLPNKRNKSEQVTKVHQPMGVGACTQPYHLGRLVVIDTCFALIRALTVQKSDGCSMKMSPNEGESTVHGCHGFPSDLPALMRVVYWPDCGLVCVSLALIKFISQEALIGSSPPRFFCCCCCRYLYIHFGLLIQFCKQNFTS